MAFMGNSEQRSAGEHGVPDGDEFSARPPSSPISPAILCRSAGKRFGPVLAVNNVSLEVARGTVLGLLGPNGAGKTTLIRALLGLTRLTSGSAEVLGEVVPSRNLHTRVGYMPQNLAIYTDLTVEQNLAFFGRLVGLDTHHLRERMDRVLSLVALGHRRTSLVSELSGGMQRRTSLAAALLPDPELLLLDEATVGVDPQLRSDFWTYFRQLAREGRTIVMTTHYMEEANQCSRVAMMHGGELLAVNTPAGIRESTGASTMDEAFLTLVQKKEGAGRRR
ncbi:MAG: ABC transporter ATP-binding protein [Thermoplasmata archaeon]